MLLRGLRSNCARLPGMARHPGRPRRSLSRVLATAGSTPSSFVMPRSQNTKLPALHAANAVCGDGCRLRSERFRHCVSPRRSARLTSRQAPSGSGTAGTPSVRSLSGASWLRFSRRPVPVTSGFGKWRSSVRLALLPQLRGSAILGVLWLLTITATPGFVQAAEPALASGGERTATTSFSYDGASASTTSLVKAHWGALSGERLRAGGSRSSTSLIAPRRAAKPARGGAGHGASRAGGRGCGARCLRHRAEDDSCHSTGELASSTG